MQTERPSFVASVLERLATGAREEGAKALLPVWFLVCTSAGIAATYFMPPEFWLPTNWGVSTATYAGLLTFNGLTLTLGWGAFGRVYDILSQSKLGEYLFKNNIMNNYLVQIDFMHLFQVLAAILSGCGLVSVVADAPLLLDRIIFAALVAATLYALKQALDAVRMMNDLVWQSALFATHYAGGAPTLTTVPGGRADGRQSNE